MYNRYGSRRGYGRAAPRRSYGPPRRSYGSRGGYGRRTMTRRFYVGGRRY